MEYWAHKIMRFCDNQISPVRDVFNSKTYYSYPHFKRSNNIKLFVNYYETPFVSSLFLRLIFYIVHSIVQVWKWDKLHWQTRGLDFAQRIYCTTGRFPICTVGQLLHKSVISEPKKHPCRIPNSILERAW